MKVKRNIAISESGFLFDSMSGESYSLNQTGKEILELLQEEKTEEEIIKKMTAEYDVDETTLERYLVDFIGMLNHFKIVE